VLKIIVPSPPLAISSVILSMGLLALGSGMLYAFIPIKLAQDAFAPWVAGSILTAMSGGSLVGCLITGLMVRRVGHARAFAALTALVILSAVLLSTGTDPMIWIVARILYGIGAAGLFIVSQSWLNDACENEWRGKVIATFYLVYIVSTGIGALVLRFLSLEGNTVPLVAILFFAFALLPVSMTRLATPAPPASITIAIRSVWRISPVGIIGLLSVGGMTMLLQGFTPIYVSAEGYSKDDVGLLMFLMQLGLIAVQYPLGALSDRIDRRYVLMIASLMVAITASLAIGADPARFIIIVLIFSVWSGATESIYSVANAHANDRADRQYYVSLSSTLLVAWSVSGMVLPGIATALMPVFGPQIFMYVAIAISVAYFAFVAYRTTRREPAPADETEPHQQLSAQIPLTPELAHLPDDANEDS